jgi:hypothetical protein
MKLGNPIMMINTKKRIPRTKPKGSANTNDIEAIGYLIRPWRLIIQVSLYFTSTA